MPLIPISSFYTACLAFMYLALCYRVVKIRLSSRVGLGFGSKELKIAGRVQMNAAEYLPLSILLLMAAELNGASQASLHLAGVLLLIARFNHAYGFSVSGGGAHSGRSFGTALNWLIIISLSLLNITLSFKYIY